MREAFALQSVSHFFNKKYWHISDIKVWNFNETLANDDVSFEQLGLGISIQNTVAVIADTRNP